MTREETLGTCLDTPEEVHAGWIGVTTAFRQYERYPLPADIPEQNRQEVAEEYPYYLAGFYTARWLQDQLRGDNRAILKYLVGFYLTRWLQVVALMVCVGLFCAFTVIV